MFDGTATEPLQSKLYARRANHNFKTTLKEWPLVQPGMLKKVGPPFFGSFF